MTDISETGDTTILAIHAPDVDVIDLSITSTSTLAIGLSAVQTRPAGRPGGQQFITASSLAYADSFDTSVYSRLLAKAAASDPALSQWSVLAVSNKTIFDGSGMKAVVFQAGEGSIVIAYMGTTASWTQIWADLQLAVGGTPKAYEDALTFAREIAGQYPDNTIYVTGHSLGGSEAEYVSWKMGYGGDQFAGTGINGFDNTSATRTPLYDYAVKGDPVANYSTDSGYAIPWLLLSDMDHVGTFKEIGSRWDAAALYTAYWSMNPIAIGYCVTLHPLQNYAKELSLTYIDPAVLMTQMAASSRATSLSLDGGADSSLNTDINLSLVNPVTILTLLENCLGETGNQDLAQAEIIDTATISTPRFLIESTSDGMTSTLNIELKRNIRVDHGEQAGSHVLHAFQYTATIDSDANIVATSQLTSKYGSSQYISAATNYGAGVSINLTGQNYATIDAIEAYSGTISSFTPGKAIHFSGTRIQSAEIDSDGNLLLSTLQGPVWVDLTSALSPTQAASLRWSSDGTDGTLLSFMSPKILELHSPGSDTVIGTDKSDKIHGSTGSSDVLIGNRGADVMKGSYGPDTFVFSPGDSGQSKGFDVIRDFTKGAFGLGDVISFAEDFVNPASLQDVLDSPVSIDPNTGIATIRAGDLKNSLQTSLAALADHFTSAVDEVGQFAFFKAAGANNYTLFISDGETGVTSNDLVINLLGIKSISSIDVYETSLGILT